MGVIFMPKHLIQQRIKCEHILSLIMHFHTRNVYCSVVLHIHISIFLTKTKMKNKKKQHPQLGFTFIKSLDVVLLMVEFHWKIRKYVTHVNKNLHQTNLKIYIYQKRASDDGDNYFWISYQILHSIHTKVGLSPTTCAHT